MKMQMFFLGFLLALTGAARAQEISYEYVELLYTNSDYEADGAFGESLGSAESEGGYINLSLAPTDRIYTKFGVGFQAIEDTPIDIASATAVVGMRFPMSDCVDMYLGVQGVYGRASDLKFPPPNVRDNRDDVDGYGLGAEIGVRAKMGSNFEFEANGNYANLFGGDAEDASGDTDDFNASVTLRFFPVPQFSLSAGYAYAFNNEIETILVGARYDFCCF